MKKDRQDEVLEKLLRRGLAPAQGAEGAECPDAERLAAYAEPAQQDGGLDSPERDELELHFAVCARCQEQLALLVRTEPVGKGLQTLPYKAGAGEAAWWRWLWPGQLNWRWLAPAGAALGVLLVWLVMSAPEQTAPLVADHRETPAPAAVPPQEPLAVDPHREPETGEQPAARSSWKLAPKVRDEVDSVASAAAQPAPGSVPVPPAAKRQSELAAERSLAASASAEPASMAAARRKLEKDPEETAALPVAPIAPPDPSADAAHKQEQKKDAEAKLARPPAGAMTMEMRKEAPVEPAPPRQVGDESGALRARGLAMLQEEARIVPSPQKTVFWRLGRGGVIERSRDAGQTWELQVSGVAADLLAGTAPSETVCWIVGRAGTLLRTTDGATWETLAFPERADLVAITAQDAERATVITSDGRSFTTRDGGRSWQLEKQ